MRADRQRRWALWSGSAIVLLGLGGLVASCDGPRPQEEGTEETPEGKAEPAAEEGMKKGTAPETGTEETLSEAESGTAAPFGSESDVAQAQALWSDRMKDYTSWAPFPGHEGWEEGTSPHGSVLRYYVNAVAAEDPDALADGSILVKENYTDESEDALVAVTVMEKIEGYDPDNVDWFWVKFSPQGEVMTNAAGTQLAGRVAKGSEEGCIACHQGAAGDDYVFAND